MLKHDRLNMSTSFGWSPMVKPCSTCQPSSRPGNGCFDTGQVPGGACGVGDLPAATTVPLVLRCCCRDLTAGDVLVLHDGAAHERAGRAEILLRALPIVLGSIRERGLAVVPVTG